MKESSRFGARGRALAGGAEEWRASFLASGAFVSLGSSPERDWRDPAGRGPVWVAWGERRRFASREDASAAGATAALYAPDFYLEDPLPWHAFRSWDLISVSDLRERLGGAPDASSEVASTSSLNWREPEREEFERAFEIVRSRIAEGRLQKGVPVVFARAEGSPDREFVRALAVRALDLPSRLRPYGEWSFDGVPRGILGASPETLFRQSAPDSVETAALAGTRPRSDDPRVQAEFLADPKERAEHAYVVEDLLASFARRGVAEAGETRLALLPTLMHLETPVRAKLDGRTAFEDLASDLHPTPALGVAPRAAGLRAMREFDDPSKRGGFGAPFGAWAAEPFVSDCLVAIRCVRWTGRELSIGSGCGVVAESRWESEWNELRAKRDAVRKALGL